MNTIISSTQSLNRSLIDTIKAVDTVQIRLKTVDEFINRQTTKKIEHGFSLENKVDVTVVYNDSLVTVAIGTWREKGALYEYHMHPSSIEYLICKKGRLSVFVFDEYRILTVGDFVAIPRKIPHAVVALEDNSSMIAICIPHEESYSKLYYSN